MAVGSNRRLEDSKSRRGFESPRVHKLCGKMNELEKAQMNEITEHYVYLALSKKARGKNSKILTEIANDEKRHYEILKTITKKDVKPDGLKIFFYKLIASLFGLTFTLRFMETNETNAIQTYSKLREISPEIEKIIEDEEKHEEKMIKMIEEERLKYIGSIVLGMNDALVELTGTLVGVAFAVKNNLLIAITGIIMGIAAALSMAASNYFSEKEEERKDPVKSAVYTGVAYLLVVFILVIPFLVLDSIVLSVSIMLVLTVCIIGFYTFYVSTIKGEKFLNRFTEMFLVVSVVTIVSFLLGNFIQGFIKNGNT